MAGQVRQESSGIVFDRTIRGEFEMRDNRGSGRCKSLNHRQVELAIKRVRFEDHQLEPGRACVCTKDAIRESAAK
jgi:hypothetical protein